MPLEIVHLPPLSLDAYAPIAGDEAVAEIRSLAEPLRDARVLHVNATKYGGGVAEILPTLTGLMRDAGLDAEWRIVPGDDAFYYVTKKNSRTKTDKLVMKKYDPVAKKHVEFREAKIR